MPHHLALTVAAYLCCLAPPPGFDPGPHAAAMADPARAGLVATRHRSRSSAQFAAAVLDDGLLGRDLAAHSAFAARVAELIDVIGAHGAATAATEAAATPRALPTKALHPTRSSPCPSRPTTTRPTAAAHAHPRRHAVRRP